MSGLSLDHLKTITRAMDVNRNNRLDDNEIDVQSMRALREASRNSQGYANDVIGTTELARAMQEDRVSLKRLTVPVADAIANALSGGDAWVSRQDFQFNDSVRARIDVNDDNRVSRQELSNALQNGTIEVGSNFRLARQSAPPPQHRPSAPTYHQPPVNHQPPSFRERGESVQSAVQRLARLYSSTSMTSSQKSQIERQLVSEELGRITHDPYLSVQQKLSTLNWLYSNTSMTGTEKSSYERPIIDFEAQRLINAPDLSWQQRLSGLKSLYQSTGMTGSQHTELERQVIRNEVDYLASDRTIPVERRLSQLEQMYRSTSMTGSERTAAERRILGY